MDLQLQETLDSIRNSESTGLLHVSPVLESWILTPDTDAYSPHSICLQAREMCCHCSGTRSHLLSKLDITPGLTSLSLFCLSSTCSYRYAGSFLRNEWVLNTGARSSVAASVLCFLLTNKSRQSDSVQSCGSILPDHKVC